MDIQYHITRASGNSKTGPIPVTTTSADSCPSTCPLAVKGCYAKSGPLAIHWRKVGQDRGIDLASFVKEISRLPKRQLWRMNQAGDLPHESGIIDKDAVMAVVKANKGKAGFTYTHHNTAIQANRDTIKAANDGGLTINLSANTLAEADTLAALAIAPVVTLLPVDSCKVTYTPQGRRVVACPAETSGRINCANCALCQQHIREYIIGFRAHGVSKKSVSLIAKG